MGLSLLVRTKGGSPSVRLEGIVRSMQQTETPRFMVAAASSGSGKTTITSGLLRCLARRGLGVVAYKCGPDYIDPMFHRSVLDTPCFNLDLYFSSPDEVRTLLGERSAAADVSVLEGVMGYYDGLGGRSTDASAYHVARETGTPVHAETTSAISSVVTSSLSTPPAACLASRNSCAWPRSRSSEGMVA